MEHKSLTFDVGQKIQVYAILQFSLSAIIRLKLSVVLSWKLNKLLCYNCHAGRRFEGGLKFDSAKVWRAVYFVEVSSIN